MIPFCFFLLSYNFLENASKTKKEMIKTKIVLAKNVCFFVELLTITQADELRLYK